ncbi:MAG TPA: hypothetical protein EYQ86_05270, partial [Bacteroidetes bacterium]|nr:hypothetical protein [Bacteroidota bacterium]
MRGLTYKLFFLLIFISQFLNNATGQNSYYMSNNYVKDCKAFFYDSDNHPINSGEYGHNEDFIFTICPENVISIDLIFSSFCTESGLDIMNIYAGSDTSAPLIGSYSGLSTPPPINTTSCITIWFVSDGNVSCSGWDAFWTAEVAAPTPPTLSLLTNPICSLTTLDYQFNFPIQCDTIIQAYWYLNGPVGNSVTATATNCSNDSTDLAQLNLSAGLNKSGTYHLQFIANIKDACDSIWTLISYDTIQISDCPLDVEIFVEEDTICPGECIDIWAEGSGGNSANYVYTWQNMPSGPGPFQVCPTTTTNYSVSLTDGTSFTASHTTTVFVHLNPTIPSDTTICQSALPHYLIASPTGGEWYGQGVTDTFNGIFHPDTAGPGIHSIVYLDINQCKDSFNINITEIDAGPVLAACPGTSPFNLTGSPSGGVWSGDSISSSGLFNPLLGGSYVLTYTNNSCSDTTQINVAAISLQPDDTLCQSDPKFDLSFSPAGGFWTGNGISDSLTGTFKPINALPGDNYLVYTANGCIDSLNIHIIEISAGADKKYCPYQSPITLSGTPAGGVWTGTGITNSILGIFDPSVGVHGNNFSLTYNVNGCTDIMVARIRETRINKDTLVFCPGDPKIILKWASIGSNPGGGSWSGPGIYYQGNIAYFDPSLSGPGNHLIVYENNTCTDTALMIVNNNAVLTDTTICYLSIPITLSAYPVGGIWSGTGITDPALGTFDPNGLPIDTFEIIYTSSHGCIDTTNIGLFDLPTLSITDLPSILCFLDTNINLILSPTGGTLTGNGIIGTSFNPSLAGSGVHQITYTYGSGNCLQSISEYVVIGDTLNVSLTASDDTSCINEPIDLKALGSGGEVNNYSFIWNNGLGNNNTHSV